MLIKRDILDKIRSGEISLRGRKVLEQPCKGAMTQAADR